jgi:hypothetical protein
MVKLTSGPFAGFEVEFGPDDRMADYESEAEAVFDLLGIEVVFYSDLTDLEDFVDNDEKRAGFKAKLDAHFRCEWSFTEPLIDILERDRIARGRSTS